MTRQVQAAVFVVMCFLAMFFFSGDLSGNLQGLQLLIGSTDPAHAQTKTASSFCILDPATQAGEMADKLAAAGDNSPVVEVPESTHDFGKISEERELVHHFTIRNVGKSVLNITKVVPG